MSKFTTEVRWICETAANTEYETYSDIDEIITEAAPRVFNFQFPIWDENYRLPLEVKILRHFYTREICEETVALWKLRLEDKLNMIMPYYNQLYQTTLLKYNPLYDTDITTVSNRDGTSEQTSEEQGNDRRNRYSNEDRTESRGEKEREVGNKSRDYTRDDTRSEKSHSSNAGFSDSEEQSNGETESDGNSTKWNLFSDTPQGGINGIEGTDSSGETVEDGYYLTTATKDTNVEHNEGTNSTTNKREENTSNVENSEFNGDARSQGDENEFENRNRDSNMDYSSESNIAGNESGDYQRNDNRNITNTEDYIEHIYGKRGGASFSKLIEEFRNNILNIDARIIKDLEPLFFGLWA